MSATKQIAVIVAMTAAIMAMIFASPYPAQAQQPFEVRCSPSGLGGQFIDCQGSGEPFAGEDFECSPETGSEDTPSQCTHEPTGETFECVITAVGGFATFIHTCGQAPPGGGDGGGGGGGGGTGGGGQQGGGGVEITQEGDQESESGEVDQTFDIS